MESRMMVPGRRGGGQPKLEVDDGGCNSRTKANRGWCGVWDEAEAGIRRNEKERARDAIDWICPDRAAEVDEDEDGDGDEKVSRG